MLSYKHSTKAGNHGDVLKHVLWALLLKECRSVNQSSTHLSKEDITSPDRSRSWRVIDTHAGGGVYDILAPTHDKHSLHNDRATQIKKDRDSTKLSTSSSEQQQIKQPPKPFSKAALSGIAKLLVWEIEDNLPTPVKEYLKQIYEFNLHRNNLEIQGKGAPSSLCSTDQSSEKVRYYPGPPILTQQFLEPNDEYFLFDIVENICQELESHVSTKSYENRSTSWKCKGVRIICGNGMDEAVQMLSDYDSPQNLLCLIDPPYEQPHLECQEAIQCIDKILTHRPHAIVMIWLAIFAPPPMSPVDTTEIQGDRARVLSNFAQDLLLLSKKHRIPQLDASLWISRDPNKSMPGSSVVVINPPATFCDVLQSTQTLEWLAHSLEETPGSGFHRFQFHPIPCS